MRKASQQEIAAPIDLKNVKEPVSARNKSQQTIFTTKQIAYIATLTGITLVFKVVSNFIIPVGTIKITLIYFCWIVSAFFLGPLGGAFVGLTTDLLGTFIAGNAVNPVITVGNTLFPLIVGLCYRYLPLKTKQISLLIGVVLSMLICTLGINSYGIYTMYNYHLSMSFLQYLIAFRSIQPLIIGINLVIAFISIPIITRLKLFKL